MFMDVCQNLINKSFVGTWGFGNVFYFFLSTELTEFSLHAFTILDDVIDA